MSPPARSTDSRTGIPGSARAMPSMSAGVSNTFRPSTMMMMSPGSMPAALAGDPSKTAPTCSPPAKGTPSMCAASGVRSLRFTPSRGLPRSCASTPFATSARSSTTAAKNAAFARNKIQRNPNIDTSGRPSSICIHMIRARNGQILGRTVPEELIHTTVTGGSILVIVFVVPWRCQFRHGKQRGIFFSGAARIVNFSALPPKFAIGRQC